MMRLVQPLPGLMAVTRRPPVPLAYARATGGYSRYTPSAFS